MLSTIVKFFIDPGTIFLMLVAVGFLLRVRKKSSGYWKACFWLAGIWFYIMTTPFIPNALVYQLEKNYDPILVQAGGNTDAVLSEAEKYRGADIVVLGAGHDSDLRLPATSSLVRNSLSRLTEGIRLYRLIPESRLVFSGFQDSWEGARSQAEMYAVAAMELGADLSERSRYALLPAASDTWEESGVYKNLRAREGDAPGEKRVIVVTNAMHMPRAIAGFRKRGFDPVGSPAGYEVKKDRNEKSYLSFGFGDLFPSSEHAGRLKSAIKEYAGRVELWFLDSLES
jgi:uncharacterized SAM-binding protein YcdF (DUF218 family)